jgi:cold shock CspA family protein
MYIKAARVTGNNKDSQRRIYIHILPALPAMSSSHPIPASSGARLLGQVKWFRKGIGFICGLDTKEDIFVHHTQLRTNAECYRCLFQGEFVEYERGRAPESGGKDRDKLQAVRVSGLRGFPLMCEVKHRERVEGTAAET